MSGDLLVLLPEMDTFECIKTRPAVRAYTPDRIPAETVSRILKAGRQSHSRRNRQPCRFIVVENPEMLARLGELATSGPFIADAPLAIAVAVAADARGADIDAARAVECLQLAAWAEGVGSCWVGGIDRDAAATALRIPRAFRLVTILPFGYPTDAERAKRKVRRRLESIAFREYFGQPYR